MEIVDGVKYEISKPGRPHFNPKAPIKCIFTPCEGITVSNGETPYGNPRRRCRVCKKTFTLKVVEEK